MDRVGLVWGLVRCIRQGPVRRQTPPQELEQGTFNISNNTYVNDGQLPKGGKRELTLRYTEVATAEWIQVSC